MVTSLNLSTAGDPALKGIVRQALIEYLESCNERRRFYDEALEDIANGIPLTGVLADHDPALLSMRADYFLTRYERLYELLLAVDFGNVTFTYDDNGDF